MDDCDSASFTKRTGGRLREGGDTWSGGEHVGGLWARSVCACDLVDRFAREMWVWVRNEARRACCYGGVVDLFSLRV